MRSETAFNALGGVVELLKEAVEENIRLHTENEKLLTLIKQMSSKLEGAVQKPSSTQLDVRQPPQDGQEVGEAHPQEEAPAQTEEVGSQGRLTNPFDGPDFVKLDGRWRRR